MAEKISVQIGLEGADEVKRELADIGAASTKAFDAAGAASQEAAGEIEKVGEATDKVKQSFNQVAQESLKTATAVATLVGTIAKYGVEIGLAVQKHRGWISSLVSMGGHVNTVVRSLGLMEVGLGAAGAAAATAAGSIVLAAAAFEALEKAATKAASGYEKNNNTLQTLAATSGKSFEELQRGEAAFGQIGISADTFRSTIGKINETLAGTEVTNLTKGMKDIVEVVKEVAAGEKGITFAGWVTAEDKVKGVAIAMKQAADSGKDATQVMLEFIRNADLATGIKVGAAFGLSEADVDRVRRLGESVSDLTQRIARAPPIISPDAAARFDAMRTSIQNVENASARLNQSLSSADFASYAASFSAALNNMKAAAINAAAGISESLGQTFRGMMTQAQSDVAAIGGFFQQLAQQTGALDFFRGLQTQAVSANAAIASFVGGVMRGFGATESSIRAVEDRINGVATAAQTAGQAAQTAGVQFTSFGTVAQQGANTAKAGVQEGVQMWTQWGTAATQAGDAATKAGQKGQEAGQQAKSGADLAWEGWNRLLQKLLEYLGLASKAGAPATGAGAPGKARGGLLGGRGTGTSDSNLAWLSRGEYIMPARAVQQPGVLAFLEALRRSGRIPGFADGGSVGGGGFRVSGFITSLGGAIGQLKDIWEAINNGIQGVNESLAKVAQQNTQVAQTAEQSLRQLQITLATILGDLVSAAQGNARGGLLGGRGTGTSDSNLAWVSRGEHIMPASAVRQPGVLAFLEALRRSGGDLSRVLDGMGRFALGGMVPRAIPAFATGGLAGGGNHVTIQFPGLPAIGGLRASSSVVDQLQKAAALAQVRSGGRKPSRYS